MNKPLLVLCLAAAIVAGGLYLAQAQAPAPPKINDPRLDKIIQQNDQILKNQEELKKTLADMKEGLLQLRRRTS